jgi:hypothetical protein
VTSTRYRASGSEKSGHPGPPESDPGGRTCSSRSCWRRASTRCFGPYITPCPWQRRLRAFVKPWVQGVNMMTSGHLRKT